MVESQVVLPGAHPLWSSSVANVFQMLRVGAAISDGKLWRPIHSESSMTAFELEHGVELARDRYNGRCLAKARRERKAVLGTHGGFSDYFVPIIVAGRVEAILVTGPFATARPTSTEILERWRRLTGEHGHAADPEFSHYVATILSTLVLTAPQVADFERLLTRLALLMSGEQPARALLEEADTLWFRLERARLVERIWNAAQEMIDERTARRWARPQEARGRALFGLPRVPHQALVGLIVSQDGDPEAVEAMLRRDSFQRQCVELARASGHAISGRVGDHGITFLSAESGTVHRRRQRLLDLVDKAAVLARRLGFRLFAGMSSLSVSASLPQHYQAALEAAESALSQGVPVVEAARRTGGSDFPLDELRRQLGHLVEERPSELPARFDRYLEAVARHCAYRLEPARVHLEAGLERITDGLRETGALEPKSHAYMLQELGRSSREARTIAELFATFRRTVADICDAVQRPRPARRDRNVRRAVAYIRAHYSEPLTLRNVAHVAGFAPNYFSVLFKRREKVTFDRYLRQLRIERAKELLATTDLDIQRVARLSGLGTRQYMARVFQRVVGCTPSECRAALRPRPVT